MPLTGIPAAIGADPALAEALAAPHADADFSAVDGARIPLVARLLDVPDGPRALLAIVATGREADQAVEAFRAMLPDAEVHAFPSWETLPHERLSPSAETVGRRLAALRALRDWRRNAGPEPFVLVTSVRAALQPLLPGLDAIEPLALAVGGRGYDLAALSSSSSPSHMPASTW